MPDKPIEIHIEDIIGKEMTHKLDEFDRLIRDYYLTLNNYSVRVFDQFMHLYSLLIISLKGEFPGFVPKFKRGSPVHSVLAASASGAFKSLRVAHKLLLDGCFAEMHVTLRMVEQWLECAVVVEGNPTAALRILEKGISGDDLRKALNSSMELKNLYRKMQKTFSKLSQRAHVTRTALDLIRPKGAKGTFIISGVVSKEMFCKDALALATMARNTVNIFLRHFQKMPSGWLNEFNKARDNLAKSSGTAIKRG